MDAYRDGVSGVLETGGRLQATRQFIRVEYPEGDRQPVTIDMADVHGVRRHGADVTLHRTGGRETILRVTTLDAAAGLYELALAGVRERQLQAFDAEIIRLHDDGFRLLHASPRMAQLVQPRNFNYLVAVLLLLLGVVPILLYPIYWLSQTERTALVTIDDDGRVMTHYGKG